MKNGKEREVKLFSNLVTKQPAFRYFMEYCIKAIGKEKIIKNLGTAIVGNRRMSKFISVFPTKYIGYKMDNGLYLHDHNNNKSKCEFIDFMYSYYPELRNFITIDCDAMLHGGEVSISVVKLDVQKLDIISKCEEEIKEIDRLNVISYNEIGERNNRRENLVEYLDTVRNKEKLEEVLF
jgi:hypothetical protein